MKTFYDSPELETAVERDGFVGRTVGIQTESNQHYAGKVNAADGTGLTINDFLTGEESVSLAEIYRLRVTG